jgi:hypothetical protein
VLVTQGFVGHRGGARAEHASGERLVGCEVKIREDGLIGTNQRDLVGLRLFHLHDQIRCRPDLVASLDDRSTVRRIVCVENPAAQPRTALHEHAVTGTPQLFDAHRQQGDAILVRFDFLRNADDHGARISRLSAPSHAPAISGMTADIRSVGAENARFRA